MIVFRPLSQRETQLWLETDRLDARGRRADRWPSAASTNRRLHVVTSLCLLREPRDQLIGDRGSTRRSSVHLFAMLKLPAAAVGPCPHRHRMGLPSPTRLPARSWHCNTKPEAWRYLCAQPPLQRPQVGPGLAAATLNQLSICASVCAPVRSRIGRFQAVSSGPTDVAARATTRAASAAALLEGCDPAPLLARLYRAPGPRLYPLGGTISP